MTLYEKWSDAKLKSSGLPKAVLAYNSIRESIIKMDLEPGAILSEKDICAEFDISRTPVREAVLRLAQEGLINVIPGDGTFVSKISVRSVIEGQIVRSSLEYRMVRLAARTYDTKFDKDFELLMFLQNDAAQRGDYDDAFDVDNEFHKLICAVAGFPNVWQTIHNSIGQLDRVRYRAFPKSGYFDVMVKEHRAIFDAIKSHDEERAGDLIRTHLDDIARMLTLVINDNPSVVIQEDDIDILNELWLPQE